MITQGKMKHFLYCLLGLIAPILRVYGQDQTGFISIDCGLPAGQRYTEQTTGLFYISDEAFVDNGESKFLLLQYRSLYQQQVWYLRYFPEGIRNCYTINITRGTKYLIRATFIYGNYDGENMAPEFDLHLGANLWDTVKNNTIKEIIHVPLQNYIHVCLVNKGSGIPFISAIELRPLDNSTYQTQMGSLAVFSHYDAGTITNKTYRYIDDIYDRIWDPHHYSEWTQVTTSLTIDPENQNVYQVPSIVMSSAATPKKATNLDLWWNSPDENTKYYVYLHFAEIEKLQTNQTRLLSITWNGKPFQEPFSLLYLTTSTVSTTEALTGAALHNLSISQDGNSTLPPILNAFEIYTVIEFLQEETNQLDVGFIQNIKNTYGVKRNWQGDPCAPQEYSWEGLHCSYNGYEPPRIISLNLSSTGLTGEIPPSFSNLTMLQTLDLSNNNLTGPVPDLSRLPNLKVLNLEKNNLTGPVPVGLIQKSNDGSLTLSLCENQNLNVPLHCGKEKKKDSIVVPVAASVVGIIILLTIVAAVIWWRFKKKRNHGLSTDVTADLPPIFQHGPMEPSQRQFTYSEVLKITNNCERIIGRGGFGSVYHGYIGDTQVAVKMLSQSSVQGYQEFHSEVNLLMRVHHRNLTSLVGYCTDGTNTGLIYEYMSNGNLHEHLLDNRSNILSWAERLRIAIDAAHGLEYLHYGCKPPIIHRDVKSTNILLNENFQAKLADFGLSRNFPAEDGTRVWTRVAGTPGYLDPEYYQSNMLNEKSNVYSFGVVLLEIITSRPIISQQTHERVHIAKWVSFMVGKGDIKSIVDSRLKGNFDSNSVWKAVEKALDCVSSRSIARPTMSEVVIELKECLALELARKKKSRHTDSEDSMEMMSLKFTTEMSPLPT